MKLKLIVSLALGLFVTAPLLANHSDAFDEASGEREELPALPAKPKDLPKTEKQLKDTKNKEYGADYCDAVNTLTKKLADSAGTLKPDLEARIKQEIQVGLNLCNAKGEFVGYSNINSPNERVITNYGALKDSLTTIWKLMVEAKMAEALMVQNTMQQMDDEYGLFVRPPIDKAYGSVMTAKDLDDALQDYAQWGHDLNDWYRKNGTKKSP